MSEAFFPARWQRCPNPLDPDTAVFAVILSLTRFLISPFSPYTFLPFTICRVTVPFFFLLSSFSASLFPRISSYLVFFFLLLAFQMCWHLGCLDLTLEKQGFFWRHFLLFVKGMFSLNRFRHLTHSVLLSFFQSFSLVLVFLSPCLSLSLFHGVSPSHCLILLVSLFVFFFLFLSLSTLHLSSLSLCHLPTPRSYCVSLSSSLSLSLQSSVCLSLTVYLSFSFSLLPSLLSLSLYPFSLFSVFCLALSSCLSLYLIIFFSLSFFACGLKEMLGIYTDQP